SAAAAPRLLAPADAVARAGRQIVDVLAIFQAELFAGLDHRGADRRTIHLRGEQRTGFAADGVAFTLPTFGVFEERQAVIPGPAAVAELSPVIVVLGLAADVDEAVDGGRAAD